MKMANPRTEMCLYTSLWRISNTHRITSNNIRRNDIVIVNIKHETVDREIREKRKLTLS
jgi:hypothetical protein